MDIQTQLPSSARYHPRVKAGFMVMVCDGGRQVVTRATDLSIDGLKLLGDFGAPGARLSLRIPLPRDRVIETHGTIVRRGSEWAAVKLDDLDWDDLFAMARFVHPRLVGERG